MNSKMCVTFKIDIINRNVNISSKSENKDTMKKQNRDQMFANKEKVYNC